MTFKHLSLKLWSVFESSFIFATAKEDCHVILLHKTEKQNEFTHIITEDPIKGFFFCKKRRCLEEIDLQQLKITSKFKNKISPFSQIDVRQMLVTSCALFY